MYLQDLKDDYIDMDEDDDNYREFLLNEPELNELAYIFITTPWEYEQGYFTNKKYEVMKDLLLFNDFDLKTCIPFFIEMSNIWSNIKNEKLSSK